MSGSPPSKDSNRSVELPRSATMVESTPSSSSSIHHLNLPAYPAEDTSSPQLYLPSSSPQLSLPSTPVSRPQAGFPINPFRMYNVQDPYRDYYYGIPSRPKLIAKSSKEPWTQPLSMMDPGYPQKKIILPVPSDHPICSIWKSPVGPKLLNIIDRYSQTDTTVDIIRLALDEGDQDAATPLIWIGVKPGMMTKNQGEDLVGECIDLLRSCHLSDVQVEVKETDLMLLNVPTLKDPFSLNDLSRPVTAKLSTALGLPISVASMPHFYGTAGFFLRDVASPDDVLMLTTQHNVSGCEFSSSLLHPKHRQGTSHRAQPVLISHKVFDECQSEINRLISLKKDELAEAEVLASFDDGTIRCVKAQFNLLDYRKDLSELELVREELLQGWSQERYQTFGHVLCFPSISYGVGLDHFTEDWSIILMDRSRLPPTMSNILDLSDPHEFEYANWSTQIPLLPLQKKGLLPIQGIVSKQEMEKGKMAVLMRGAKSGLRLGCAMPIESNIKKMDDEGAELPWSQEWLVTTMPDDKFTVFSNRGDSGAAVVTRDGRAAGIVTAGGGSAQTGAVDATYVTPLFFILDRMREMGFSDPQLL